MNNRFAFLFMLLYWILPSQAQENKARLMLPIGHTDGIHSAVFSPDGKSVLTASNDHTAKIWEVETGKQLASLEGHTDDVTSAVFSPDGKKILTASRDKTAKIWDAQSGELLTTLKGHTDGVTSAVLSPDGKKILTESFDNTAKIWDAQIGNLLTSINGYEIYPIGFSSDSRNLIYKYGIYNTTEIKNVESGKILKILENKPELVKFSNYHNMIVTASDDRIAKVWDAQSGKLFVNIEGHISKNIHSVDFSIDDEKIVITSLDSIVKIWEIHTGKLLASLEVNTNTIYSAIFSIDGKKIITIGDDNTRIWDVETGKLLTSLEISGIFTSVIKFAEFISDGKKIVLASESKIAIWEIQTGKILKEIELDLKSAKLSNDRKKILTTDNYYNVYIWDVESLKLLSTLEGHSNGCNSAIFGIDGNRIIAEVDYYTKTWDVETGKLLATFNNNHAFVYTERINPDNNKINLVYYDGIDKVRDAESGILMSCLDIYSNEIVTNAVFSPNGEKLFTESCDTAKIWDTQSGKLLANLEGYYFVGYNSNIMPIFKLFSPDCKYFVSVLENVIVIWDAQSGQLLNHFYCKNASWFDKVDIRLDIKKIVRTFKNTFKIWDAESGKLLVSLEGHKRSISSAVFSPDGKKIVTASRDGTSKIWEAQSGKWLATLKGHKEDVISALFSPNGKKVITASLDGTSKIWDSESGKLLVSLEGHKNSLNSAFFSPDEKRVITASADNTSKIWDAETGKLLYTFIAIDSSDYLVYDTLYRYDGTEGARKLLYFTCGTNIIELEQLKDQLWVPNLVERLNKGEAINAKSLDELDICNLMPKVEEITGNSTEYTYKITPQRGGLGATVLFINGIEVKRYSPHELKMENGIYTLYLSSKELEPFFVVGKENRITVKAYTANNDFISRGAEVKTQQTKTSNVSPPNLYAVMIGVSDYKGEELDLKYAAKDAQDLSDMLALSARKLLNTDGKEHVFMYNLTTAGTHDFLPEKKSIKSVLKEIGEKANANDILLMFFAGHGIMQGDAEKKQFYFLPADASKQTISNQSTLNEVGISTAELTEWIKPQLLKAQKRVLIFDACNSGQAINDFVKMGNSDQQYLAARNDDNALQIKAIDKLNERSGLFILSASASSQNAYEMGKYSQGLLTYSLLKVIKEQPDILEDGKYLNLSRWFSATEKMVSDLSRENGARQNPQIVSNTNFNVGKIDNEVLQKIILPQEKPMFISSNFQNADAQIADDDLEISKIINAQLNELSTRGSDSKIVFTVSGGTTDTYFLSGRYTVNGNEIVITVNLKQNKIIKNKFEIVGSKNNLEKLAKDVTEKAINLLK